MNLEIVITHTEFNPISEDKKIYQYRYNPIFEGAQAIDDYDRLVKKDKKNNGYSSTIIQIIEIIKI